MMKLYYLPFLLALLFSVSPLQAEPESVSKQQAVEIAQQHFPGRVLSVKRKGEIIQVKILNTEGSVRIIKIDAHSGKIHQP